MARPFTYILLIVLFLNGCSKDNSIEDSTSTSTNNNLESGWTVPLNQLVISPQPPDNIASLDEPYFEPLSENNLHPEEDIFVYRYGDVIKVYPLQIIWKHEIINDQIDDHFFAVTYCPLTGSAVAWDREINGTATEFGVSGHLYNDNLIPYDRNSLSYWSQMQLVGIKGKNAGNLLRNEFLLSTKGSTIMSSFPDALILVDSSNVASYSYNTSSLIEIIKPENPINKSTSLSIGGYFGVVKFGFSKDQEALLFDFNVFDDSIQIVQTTFSGSKLIVIGSKKLNFIIAFRESLGGESVQYFPEQNVLPVIFADGDGNKYDITGLVISGPLAGTQLSIAKSYWARNFAWDLFFGDNYELFED